MQLFLACFHIYYIYYYSHCTMQGLKVLRISLSELHLNNDKWDKKVRLGVNIFDKRILVSSSRKIRKVRLGVNIFDKRILVSSSRTQCFRIGPGLQQSFLCSWYKTSIIVHGAQSM